MLTYMSLIELYEVKSYLKITDSSQDGALENLYIPAAEGIVIGAIGDISKWEKTETIETCDVEWCYDGQYINLENINVLSITSINGTTYTDNLKILAPNNRRIRVQNLSTYIEYERCFDIVYEAGYEDIPAEIKLVVCTIISMLRSQKAGQTVKEYKVWDTTVKFAESQEMETSLININNILARYRTFSL